jgi:hypothetical protein
MPVLRLLLPIDDAPALRSNSSIYVFAGRGGFKQVAIIAALLPVCTDNLNAGVAVMKSAQDGA